MAGQQQHHTIPADEEEIANWGRGIFCRSTPFKSSSGAFEVKNAPSPIRLHPQPARPGSKPVYQDAGSRAVYYAEYNRHHPENLRGHPKLHQKVTAKVGHTHNHLIHSAFQLCPCIIGLKKVIDRQIVDGEKHAHAKNGHNQYQIIYRMFCSS